MGRVHDALARMRRDKTTVAALARRAGVSRTFLHDNPQARAAVAEATTRTTPGGLTAARSNLRFQDRRLADLEARLLDPTSGT